MRESTADRAVDGGRIGRALGGVLVAGTIAAATMVSLAPPSQVAAIGACTTNWTARPATALWATAGNWDNGVPDAVGRRLHPGRRRNGRQRRHHVARVDHRQRHRQRRAHHPAGGHDGDADRDAGGRRDRQPRGVAVRRQRHDPRRHRRGTRDLHRTTTAPRVHKAGASTGHDAAPPCGSTNAGTIDVDQSGLWRSVRPGSWARSTYQVAVGTSLTIEQRRRGDPVGTGAYDADGGGTVTVNGELDSHRRRSGRSAPARRRSTPTPPWTPADNYVHRHRQPRLPVRQPDDPRRHFASRRRRHHGPTGGHDRDPRRRCRREQLRGVAFRSAAARSKASAAGADVETFTNHNGATVHKAGTSTGHDAAPPCGSTNAGTIDVDQPVLWRSTGPGSWARSTYQVAVGYVADDEQRRRGDPVGTASYDADRRGHGHRQR